MICGTRHVKDRVGPSLSGGYDFRALNQQFSKTFKGHVPGRGAPR